MLVKCVAHRKNSVMLAAPLMRMTGIKKKKKMRIVHLPCKKGWGGKQSGYSLRQRGGGQVRRS